MLRNFLLKSIVAFFNVVRSNFSTTRGNASLVKKTAWRSKTSLLASAKESLKRKNIKHDYFDSINTPTKAYLLGYYIADGCCTLQKSKYTINKSIKFSCTEQDIKILQFLKKELL